MASPKNSPPARSGSSSRPGSLARQLGIDERPIIVAGMHRCGTTMLAKLLTECGVFMGKALTGNHESVFFQRINKDLLDLFGCSWAHLEGFPPVEVLSRDLSEVKKNLRTQLLNGILPEHFGADRKPAGLTWGWKDPRNSISLPLLHEFFPQGRVVFIYRDPRDAALSLIAREARRYDANEAPDLEVKRARFQQYLGLWDEYNARALEALPLFKTSITLGYEAFVRSPKEGMMRLLEMLRIPVPANLDETLKGVRGNRVHPFLGPDGESFRDIVVKSELFRRWYGE